MKQIIVLIITITLSLAGLSQEDASFTQKHQGIHKFILKEVLQTKNYTYLVIGISLGVAAFLGALDFIFTIALEQILN